MAIIESAWKKYPGYRIDLVPYVGTARVWQGDRLLAESRAALRVIETDHVERLYFPEGDVRLELFEPNDHHTVCPFKGEADYWTLMASEPAVEDVFWTYRDPFDEVGGLKGYLGVYHEKVQVELETRWSERPDDRSLNRFPAWGDESDLLRLIDVQEVEPLHYVGPTYHERTRNVVEGGQLLAQAIVAAAKANPGQRVTSAYATFAKAASFDAPIDVLVEPLRLGRTLSTVAVRGEQGGRLVSPALVLMDTGAPEVIQNAAEMPPVAGPEEAEPFDMGVTGRDLRVVDGAYSNAPDLVGPPVIYAWMRFRDDPAEEWLRSALVAQATTHWAIAAAMRPHPGIGQAQAHVTLSTGITSVAIAFHDDAPLDEWFLYANQAIWSGRGLAHGEGRVYSHDGRLIASYSVQGLVRGFSRPPEEMGKDARTAM